MFQANKSLYTISEYQTMKEKNVLLLNITHSVLTKMNLQEIRVDRRLTIGKVRQELAQRFGSLPENISLHFSNGGAFKELTEEDLTLKKSGVSNFDTIHIVDKNPAVFLLQFEESAIFTDPIEKSYDFLGDTFIPVLGKKISF